MSEQSEVISAITAVVLVYNQHEGACRVLEAVKQQTLLPTRILVVDNASPDGSADYIAERHPDVEIVRLTENCGVGAGHNAGLRVALADPACEFIWSLEHDCFPDPQCLQHLLDNYQRLAQDNTSPVVVFPAQVPPYDTHRRPHIAIRFFNVRKLYIYQPTEPPTIRPNYTFNGTLFPVTVLRTVGLLNEEFFFGFEDGEHSWRGRQAGIQHYLVPVARIVHNVYRDSRHFDLKFMVIMLPGHASTLRVYYGIRNAVHMALNTNGRAYVFYRYGIGYLFAQLNDIIFGPNRKQRLRARTLGLRDGLQARLGKATYDFL